MTGLPEASPRLRLRWHGQTVVGKVRTNNEDTLWAAPLGEAGAGRGDSQGQQELAWPGVLLAVADGMGGALAGEVASGLSVTTLADELGRHVESAGPDGNRVAEAVLVQSVEAANQRIRKQGEANPQQRGMGTTLTVAWAHGQTAVVAQVGDSRAYLFRGGELRQLTKDQSLVGKLIEDGIITEEEAERIAGRNIILQALGSEEELQVVHQIEDLQPSDFLLLCTDGLTTVVNNNDIEARMQRGGDAAALCKSLIEMAEERGGPDNITVLLAKVERA
jgi:protein phosphatase